MNGLSNIVGDGGGGTDFTTSGIGLFTMLFGGGGGGGGGGASNTGATGSSSLINNQFEMIKFGITLLFVTWIITLFKNYLMELIELIKNRFYFTAHLTYPDAMFVFFLEWLSAQKTIIGTRGVSVMARYQNVESDENEQMDVKLLPTGTQWITYKGHLISVVRITSNKRSFDGLKDDSLHITVYGGNKEVVNSILETAVQYSLALNKDKTKIYSLDPSASFWECIACQNKRLVDSVFLDSNTSEKVVADLSNFIHGKKWYTDTGVPYRRGYLLYGPPGSGKTSFILSMAGHFGKSISIMNMSKGINDGNIHSIIQKCNKDTILVLEDIDAVFIKRKNQSENNVLTFSALLNAIDGLASSDGRILMMTTNHLDRLSPALIRPGRIDLKVKFDFASPLQIEMMFKRFFDKKYHYIVTDIINQLHGNSISTAQLQGWFIIYRDNPLELLPTCQDFIKQCLTETNSNDNITKQMKDELSDDDDENIDIIKGSKNNKNNNKNNSVNNNSGSGNSSTNSSSSILSPSTVSIESPLSTDNSNIDEQDDDDDDEIINSFDQQDVDDGDDYNKKNKSSATTRKRK